MHVRSAKKLRNQTIIYLGKLQYPIRELVLTQDVPFSVLFFKLDENCVKKSRNVHVNIKQNKPKLKIQTNPSKKLIQLKLALYLEPYH